MSGQSVNSKVKGRVHVAWSSRHMLGTSGRRLHLAPSLQNLCPLLGTFASPVSASLMQLLFVFFSDPMYFPILGAARGSNIHTQWAFSEGQQCGNHTTQTGYISHGQGRSLPGQSNSLPPKRRFAPLAPKLNFLTCFSLRTQATYNDCSSSQRKPSAARSPTAAQAALHCPPDLPLACCSSGVCSTLRVGV